MRFLNPRTDFAFKKIFGSQQNKTILISFLNAILYQEQATIEDLEILDPYQAPHSAGLKDSYLDVKARLEDGQWVVIEMQVLNTLGFKKRVLYNAAKAFCTQLQSGYNYTQLHPTIALTITDFLMFSEYNDVISRYQFREATHGNPYRDPTDIELVFVELPKFQKSLEALETLTDRWIYFLKQAETLTLIPDSFATSEPLRQAFEVANLSALSPEEFDLFERKQMQIHDNENAILLAQQTKAQDIARSLLGLLPPEVIAEKTGLSIAQIQALDSPKPSA